jgi:dTDP-4-dehydrorhamnose 3,5-epimerase
VDFEPLDTALAGLVLLEGETATDERGFLVETYRRDSMREAGIECEFVQENQSRSLKGTLRGIHFQTSPGQAKLVRCARGRILDVAVDLRRDSPSFARWEAHELSDENQRQLFLPVGFGHGFLVLSGNADVVYRLSSYYDPTTEAGIAWDDPDVGIDWPATGYLISDRDQNAPRLAEVRESLPW